MNYIISATSLNLRSSPRVEANNKLTTLPHGTELTKISDSSNPDWWQVRANLNGTIIEGFVSKTFLTPSSNYDSQAIPPLTWPARVHLSTGKATSSRNSNQSRAFPLGESTPAWPTTPNEKIHAIIDWLDVVNSLRYAPITSQTYCNIYAYDVCFLSGAFIPRVWWKDQAIQSIKNKQPTPVHYGQTVRELNANALFDWFEDYGPEFGWIRSFDTEELQQNVNNGHLGIIVAQHINSNSSGHITVTIPERDTLTAKRSNRSTIPLQSQTGRSPIKYFSRNWWSSTHYRSFAFWHTPV